MVEVFFFIFIAKYCFGSFKVELSNKESVFIKCTSIHHTVGMHGLVDSKAVVWQNFSSGKKIIKIGDINTLVAKLCYRIGKAMITKGKVQKLCGSVYTHFLDKGKKATHL